MYWESEGKKSSTQIDKESQGIPQLNEGQQVI